MKKFVKNWSYLTISNFIQQGIGFICLIRIARLFGPDNLGIYTIILTAVGIGQVISTLGLKQIIIREIARRNEVVSIIARKMFNILVLPIVISSFLLIIYLIFFAYIQNITLLIFSIFYLFSYVLWNIFESLAFGKQEMQLSSIIGIISSAIWLGFVLILPQQYFTLNNVFIGFVLIQIGKIGAYYLVELQRNYFYNNNLDSNIVNTRLLLIQSLPLYGTQLLTIPISQLPLLFLGQFSSKSEVAYYGIGNKLVLPILLITENLLAAIYPILAQNFVIDRSSYIERSKKFFLAISFSGIFIAIIFSILSKQIVSILFGIKYLEASKPLLTQIWISMNMVLLSFIGTIFLSSNNERLMIKLSLFNGIFIGTASFIGSHYGAKGLALSIWISLLIGFLLHWYFVRKLNLIVINKKLEFAFLALLIVVGNALIIIG